MSPAGQSGEHSPTARTAPSSQLGPDSKQIKDLLKLGKSETLKESKTVLSRVSSNSPEKVKAPLPVSLISCSDNDKSLC